jgi:hypothetical protein
MIVVMQKGYFLVVLLVFSALVWSAEYQIKTVPVLPIESYPARIAVDGITVAADPYQNDEKSYTAFDVKDLNTRGYFPLHVIIRNSTQNFLSLKTRNVVLVTATGQELYTISSTVVVGDIFKGGQATSMKKGSPLVDFTEKELTSRQITPEKVVNGFLFFYSSEPKKNLFAGSTLRIPQITDDDNRKSIGPFLIPLDPALHPETSSEGPALAKSNAAGSSQ